MIYESLLAPWEKIKDDRTALQFNKFQTKLSLYVSQNASFLWYSPAQTAAACLLLTMKLNGLFEIYKTDMQSVETSPTIVWDRSIEKLTGLLFSRDI